MDEEEEQLDLPLEDTRLYVETTSATSDSVLYHALNEFDRVFVIGVKDGELNFRVSDGNLFFWNWALDKSKEFLMRQ